jgi:hypothetical protein
MILEDSDRVLIVETLEQAGWIVGGPRGPAAKLGLKRTTLLAKMHQAALTAAPLMNARMSALITSAFVVIMPCEKPG